MTGNTVSAPLPKSTLYRAHVENLRSVKLGVDHSYRLLKRALAEGNDSASESLLRVYSLLAGAWAECRLRKLIYEGGGFNDVEIANIISQSSQHERWLAALDYGFARRYSATIPLTSRGIGKTAFLRYAVIKELVENEVRPLIETRNRLAHGQWVKPLNSDETGFSVDQFRALRGENALSAHYKLRIIEFLALIIHDLVVGQNAFERDFDENFERLENFQRDLVGKSYDEWRLMLVDKHRRGISRRAASARANHSHEGRPATHQLGSIEDS